MANEPTPAPEGQSGTSQQPPEGTSQQPPTSPEGRAEGEGATAEGRAKAPDAELNLGVDPSTLPPELQSLWEQTHGQMKSTFTKKMQEIGDYREKVAAYDAFTADPVGQLQALASQYGLSLTRADARNVIQQQQGLNQPGEWDGQGDPPTWDAVLSRAKNLAKQELLQELQPMLGNVQRLQAQSVEQQLNAIDPDWRMYESEMRHLLKQHPTLSGNMPMLYRMAIPDEVHTERAMSAAQKRLSQSAGAARVGSTATRTVSQPAPKKVESFDDAVAEAKRKLGSG